ncbi:MAG: hypothetical protein CM1200mP29_15990 [Verrucomicrobiota bacterium]|nr:MAG: hypothetical protein CM1200mP29_15990 [Verrucomicrobiota bacterium]
MNLEYLACGVLRMRIIYYPDTLVGTDSHTTMINGLGHRRLGCGWHRGRGRDARTAGLLPDTGRRRCLPRRHAAEGVTAPDLALTVPEILREAKVVGKFVEFYGEGARQLPLTDRATIANMAPEYGATMGFFPIDAETVNYLRATAVRSIVRLTRITTGPGTVRDPGEGETITR